MALPAKANLPQNGSIVSRWYLGEASGVSRADSVGSNTLTNNNTVTQGTGKFGVNDSVFNGSSQYLSRTNASQTGLGVAGNFSMSCWVKFSSVSGTMTLLGKYLNTGNQRSYLWQVSAGSNQINMYTSSSGGTAPNLTVSWTPSTGTWYLLSVAYATSGNIAFYVNGVQQGSTQTGGATSIFSSTADFQIGAWGGATDWIAGEMEDAIFWGGVTLSSGNMTSLYNAYSNNRSQFLAFM